MCCLLKGIIGKSRAFNEFMKKDITTRRCLSILVVTLLMSACATQKSRQDQSKIGKIYHDVTAKYNGWFNANEIVQESILQLESQHQDNYNEILPLYRYRAATNPQAVAANLDEAIKKVSVVATLHENSQWTDDCYLLIGQSFYLKQDFESAQNALEFFMDEFNPDGTRINKKARRKNPNARKTQSKASVDSARKKSAVAKAQERERKQYNKQVRKDKKQSSRKGDENSATTQRKTARDAPAITLEAQQAQKAAELEKKGGDENPGALKHTPAHQEASLWLARTYVERENYPGAERLLNGLRSNPDLQEEVKKELPIVAAYYALKRKNYAGAIPHLESAVELADKKSEKARLAFIMAQIAELEKNYELASQYYERVLDNNPDYVLAFNARLNMARTKLEAGGHSVQDVATMLEKMLKDEKNADYKDQIYFTLAQLALKEPNVSKAIANLQLAAEHGDNNSTQLTETNFLLAQLYFDTGDYVNAKSAYDATLVTMSKTDARYRQVDRMSRNLTDIARYLTDITMQDSLLAISMMSEQDRMDLAKKLHKEAASAAQSSAQNSNLPQGGAGKGNPGGSKPGMPPSGSPPPSRPTAGISATPSTFFAYQQKELKRGQREFENNWGDRRLSDNWRVSALASSSGTFDDPVEEEISAVDVITKDDISKIFRDVPDSEEKKVVSHEIIQNAMLQLGSLYRDKLEDYNQSIEILEKLLSTYPDTKFALDAYYQLYLSYISINNHAKAEYYKNRIITEYGSSKYALVLTDPDYLSKQLSEEQRLDRNYQEVYKLVEKGEYEEAKSRIDEARQTFGTAHPLQAKYSILEAMCIGNLEGKEAYVEALKGVIGGYPGTPEETKARDMLLLLGEYQGSRLNLSTASGPDYKVALDAQHFVLVQITGTKDADAQDVKVSISNYNRKYHSLDKLKISSLRFDTQGNDVIVLVRSFKDGAAAVKYFEGTKKNPDEFVPAGTNFEVFPVTQHNYREIVSQKSIESYRPFFKEHYKE